MYTVLTIIGLGLCGAEPAGQPATNKAPATNKPPANQQAAATQQAAPATQPTAAADRPKPTAVLKPVAFEMHEIEQSVVDLTNAERARHGLPALAIDPQLMQSARSHATWMTNARSLRHTSAAVAENIATGQTSPHEAVRCWMNSSGHRANILNWGHRRIGVAAYQTPEGQIFWCQQFWP